MKELYSFILSIVSTAGGFAAASFAIIKFGGTKIVELFFEIYKHLQQKNLEKYKADMDNRKYVTQKHYDKYFDIYEDLTIELREAMEHLLLLIPPDGKMNYPVEHSKWIAYVSDNYNGLIEAYKKAQSAVFKFMPFIEEDQEKVYLEILDMIKMQIELIENVRDNTRMDLIHEDDLIRTKQISEKMIELNRMIRTFLHSLEVIV